MTPTVIILIILASIIIVAVIRHTHGKDNIPPKPKVADETITPEQAKQLYSDGELTTRAGYLHYDLSEAYEVSEKVLGTFVGYVKPDAQHDGDIIVYDNDGQLRGKINGQREYYSTLLSRGRTNCYGFVLRSDDGNYHGEVCVRKL